MKQIPLVNLSAQYQSIKDEIQASINEVLDCGAFIQGKFVKAFQDEFIQHHVVPFAVGCSNGTSAISLLLEALGVGPGDEVILPTNTFFATAGAVCHVGATPVFVDIDADSYLISIEGIAQAINENTKAIIPVHLYGNVVPMQELLELAKQHQLFVVEDCAQAHLAQYQDQYVGSFADGGTFSFYPGKNLGAYGDAGLVVCSNEAVINRVSKLVNHGRAEKYTHDIVGYNHRMDGIQAAVLSAKVKHLEKWTSRRRENAKQYDQRIDRLGCKRVAITPDTKAVYHLYVIEVDNRDAVIEGMAGHGVSCGVHYPLPLHLQPAFSNLGYQKGDFPIAERAANRIMSLPMCGDLSSESIDYICTHLEQEL